MPFDWNQLEGPEAAEKILRAAVSCGAAEINLSADAEGATIFFLSQEQIEFFDHLPTNCRDVVRESLKVAAGIDLWKPAPASGCGVLTQGNAAYDLEVRTVANGNSEDQIGRAHV
jgi:hypothetical protein